VIKVPINIKMATRKIETLGEGSYGRVYSALPGPDLTQRLKIDLTPVAIKRNFVDDTSKFIGNLRELDFLSRLKNHPNIVQLHGTSFSPLFPMTPLSKAKMKNSKIKDDHIHFIFEKSDYDVESLLQEKTCRYMKNKYNITWAHYKEIMFQTLLGLEYMHSCKMINRDIKPLNTLIFLNPPYGPGPRENFKEPKKKKNAEASDMTSIDQSEFLKIKNWSPENGLLRVKLCDFGMAKNIDNQENSTPRTYTPWYRPPEVFLKLEYSEKSDIWATGIFFYELLYKEPLVYHTDDGTENMIQKILLKMPYFVDFRSRDPTGENKLYIHSMNLKKIKRKDTKESTRKSFYELLKEKVDENEFSLAGPHPTTSPEGEDIQYHGSLFEFADLISKMLRFFSHERLSATECLNHPFFDQYRDRINKVRLNHPPPMDMGDMPLCNINCEERTWFADLALKLFDIRKEFKWWNSRILFHAIDIFDRYLVLEYKKGDKSITKTKGKLLTQKETYHRFIICIYIFMKYYSTMEFVPKFEDIAEDCYLNDDHNSTALEFEKQIIELFDGKLFQPTLYEYEYPLTENEQLALLKYLLSENSNNKTRKEIYELVLPDVIETEEVSTSGTKNKNKITSTPPDI
jgi:serine/threonine protein kinase